jgi:hypothetical protein
LLVPYLLLVVPLLLVQLLMLRSQPRDLLELRLLL